MVLTEDNIPWNPIQFHNPHFPNAFRFDIIADVKSLLESPTGSTIEDSRPRYKPA